LRWWYHREKEAIRSTKIDLWSKQLLLGGGRVLGDGLGAFWDGVLGKLTGEDETDAWLRVRKRREKMRPSWTYEVWISREEMVDFLL
jgi:hypothetical protein